LARLRPLAIYHVHHPMISKTIGYREAPFTCSPKILWIVSLLNVAVAVENALFSLLKPRLDCTHDKKRGACQRNQAVHIRFAHVGTVRVYGPKRRLVVRVVRYEYIPLRCC